MSTIKTYLKKTEESRNYDDLRKLPLALREFYGFSKAQFDHLYDNRRTIDWLQRFKTVKYPVLDRDYGSPNENMCNIFFNIINDKEVQELIDRMTFDRQWFFHPIRKFDKWHTIAQKHYQ